MGQRQLVALARVLLQDPAIFILDEATASVDPFTEAQIQEGLDMVMRDRTSIVIAHRLSDHQQRRPDHRAARTARSSKQGNHDNCWRRAGTTPNCTTPTSATNRWSTSSKHKYCSTPKQRPASSTHAFGQNQDIPPYHETIGAFCKERSDDLIPPNRRFAFENRNYMRYNGATHLCKQNEIWQRSAHN